MPSAMIDSAAGCSVCPGCGLRLPTIDDASTSKIRASPECQRLCHKLAYYTLSRGDALFIHQVAVDAYAAQHAGPSSKPISIAFALIGLCLVLERGCTGKEAQLEHMRLATLSKTWPPFDPPASRGSMTVADVLESLPGEQRDAALNCWAASVWEAWKHEHAAVRLLIDRYRQHP